MSQDPRALELAKEMHDAASAAHLETLRELRDVRADLERVTAERDAMRRVVDAARIPDRTEDQLRAALRNLAATAAEFAGGDTSD